MREIPSLVGFTLIEVIMVIVTVGILAFGTGIIINAITETWTFINFREDIVSHARIAMDRMVREIRQIKDKNNIILADQSEIKFIDIDNNTISFFLLSSSLYRGEGTTSYLLADNISSLQFQYRDINGNLLSTPVSNTSLIWRIILTIKVQRSDQSFTLRTQIFPRNFQY